MLYSALPSVLVLTEPAFRDVRLTAFLLAKFVGEKARNIGSAVLIPFIEWM